MILSLFLFMFCLFFVLFFNIHYMYMLLILEMILLSIFIFMTTSYLVSWGTFGLFIFMLILVCMGGFSISLLVSVSRSWGKDFWFSQYLF